MNTKYTEDVLLTVLRKCIVLRNELNSIGFTDNGGAIHSVERVLELLCIRRKYSLTHINSLKRSKVYERTLGATKALEKGEAVRIEHVHPIREWTRSIIDKVNANSSDDEILEYIDQNYRLVLVSKEEAKILDRKNRSRMELNRLESAGLVLDTSNLQSQT
ncbi:hypothetical protein ACRFL2_14115 [Klebsiella aerogenes]|uniref:hypothetical protein n=1 Tax=Klebsiella aerogenes TaxID=548 RepID=UPI003D6CAED5